MKVPKKIDFQQIVINHSSGIDFNDFTKIYKKCTEELYSFLANNAILLSENLIRFRENLFE